MDPGEILRGHHISNFEKENTRDNRLFYLVKLIENLDSILSLHQSLER